MEKSFLIIKKFFKDNYFYKRLCNIFLSIFVIMMSNLAYNDTSISISYFGFGIFVIINCVDYYTIISYDNTYIRLVKQFKYVPLELTTYKQTIFYNIIKLALLYTIPGNLINILIYYADNLEITILPRIIYTLCSFLTFVIVGFLRLKVNTTFKNQK